jgi:hypothetical protein
VRTAEHGASRDAMTSTAIRLLFTPAVAR